MSDIVGRIADLGNECHCLSNDKWNDLRRRVEELINENGRKARMLGVAKEALRIVAEGKEICGQAPNPEYVYVHGLTIENLQRIARDALAKMEDK